MENYKDVKIAVYAICKNESKFVERWLRAIWDGGNGANGVYILDTGSEDDTLECFRKAQKKIGIPNEWLTVKQKKYEKWRFDTARNDNMDMIPKEKYDIFYCLDLDEIVISDFWVDLRKEVFLHPNFKVVHYLFACTHDAENDEPKWCFWKGLAFSPNGWKWKYCVHEVPCYTASQKIKDEERLYLDSNKVYVHHRPDNTKSRGQYLKLIEERCKEDEQDLYGLYYLAREYRGYGRFYDALAVETKLYCHFSQCESMEVECNEILDDYIMLPMVCCNIGDYYRRFGIKEDAEYYYKKAIKKAPELRDGYIKLAQLLAYCDRPYDCYQVLSEMHAKTKKQCDWRIVDYYWRDWKIYQIIADAKCWEQKYDEAKSYFEQALADLKTETDQREAASEGFYSDYEWLKSHHPELFVS